MNKLLMMIATVLLLAGCTKEVERQDEEKQNNTTPAEQQNSQQEVVQEQAEELVQVFVPDAVFAGQTDESLADLATSLQYESAKKSDNGTVILTMTATKLAEEQIRLQQELDDMLQSINDAGSMEEAVLQQVEQLAPNHFIFTVDGAMFDVMDEGNFMLQYVAMTALQNIAFQQDAEQVVLFEMKDGVTGEMVQSFSLPSDLSLLIQ